ncbi:MAG: hypothetical protein ACO3MB_07640 [Saprospiraceae bacterium]
METPKPNPNELTEALRENREEAQSLTVDEEAKKEAAAKLGLTSFNPAGTWGKKNELHFKAYYNPPNFGSIHYRLSYAREVLVEARERRAFKCEIKCAITGLEVFTTKPSGVHQYAALRIHEQLGELYKGYTRKK